MVVAGIMWSSCGGNEPEPKPDPQPQAVAVTGVTLNKTTLTLEAGASETLTADVVPQNATNKAVVWSSNDGAVATVDNSGKVTAIASGVTTITVITGDGGKTATCAVTVTSKAVMGISLNKTTLSLISGASETLIATISPDDAANKNVTWSSSNDAVATVDNEGTVTAVAKGVTAITVSTNDGGKTATCEVTVEAKYFVSFKYDGKDYRITDDKTCIFTKQSDSYYVIACSDAATTKTIRPLSIS